MYLQAAHRIDQQPHAHATPRATLQRIGHRIAHFVVAVDEGAQIQSLLGRVDQRQQALQCSRPVGVPDDGGVLHGRW
ncbi:hypothetical protein SDC9_184521 [bioreactor metagenome]|uniref:Uncharacterized protein n=1 Tax=bioreactor metagenome TaxID=1076179 RepID=A0A645HFR2_9ZZZZ